MRRVVDSSAWIEWLVDGPASVALATEFPARAECVVPTIVQLELAKWLTRERGEEAADETIAFTQKCIVVPLDTLIAVYAADLCRQHKLATADAVIYATAQKLQADLLTCDAHFMGLPGVVYIAKGSP